MRIKKLDERIGEGESNMTPTEMQTFVDAVRRVGKREVKGTIFVIEEEENGQHRVRAYANSFSAKKAIMAACVAMGMPEVGTLFEHIL